MAKKTVTSKELNAILAQVAKEVEDLAKSEDGKEAPGEKTPEGSSTEGTPEKSAPHKEPDGDEGSSPSAPSDGDGDEGGAPKGDTSAPAAPPAAATPPAPPAAPPAAPGAPGADMGAPAPLDPQALIAEFRQMPPEEVKMFLLAAKQVVMEQGGGAGGDAPAAPSGSPALPPAPPAAPPAPPASPAGSPPVPPGPDGVAKGEMKSSPGNGGEIKAGKLAKSEDVIALETAIAEKDAALKKAQDENALIAAKLDEAIKGITTLIQKTALRKSISSTGYQGKPDGSSEKATMTRAQALEKVRELSATPDASLTKSERETLNKFWMDSTMPVEKVQGILNKKEK